VCGLNLEKRIFDKILCEVDSSSIPDKCQSVLPLYLLTGTIIDFFHWSGNSSIFQVECYVTSILLFPISRLGMSLSMTTKLQAFFSVIIKLKDMNKKISILKDIPCHSPNEYSGNITSG
jgi:hypothetical protein